MCDFIDIIKSLFGGIASRMAEVVSVQTRWPDAVAAGELDQKVPEDPAIHELAVVGGAFNAMTASLRQADQAKTAFISDVSHELRTPLTVIKGTIETVISKSVE
jgi:signal transduction histidine kinase